MGCPSRSPGWLAVAVAVLAATVGCPKPTPPVPTPPPPTPSPPAKQTVVTIEGVRMFVAFGDQKREVQGESRCCCDPMDKGPEGCDALDAQASRDESGRFSFAFRRKVTRSGFLGLRTSAVYPPIPNGWPLATKAYIDKVARGGKVNMMEFRAGPYLAGSEGAHGYPGGYDIIPVVAERVRYANSKGIAVIIGLIDCWSGAGNCQDAGGPPTAEQVRWVTALVQATKGPGTIYFDGNEAFLARPSDAWRRGVVAAAKAAGATYVGTSHTMFRDVKNSYVADFVTLQDFFIRVMRADVPPVPVLTTETTGAWITLRDYEAYRSTEPGIYLGYWWGQVSPAVRDHVLGVGPDPGPVCADRTAIGRIGVKVFQRGIDATPKDQFGQPYGSETPEEWVQRGRCEMEKGFPFEWSVNGRPCADYPAEGFTCWLGNANPMFLSGPPTGSQVGICPRDSSGNDCGYMVVP